MITPDELARRLTARGRGTIPLPGRAAAVLVALSEREVAGVRVLLIKRPATMRRHGGQYALPGGRRDPQDASAVQTALREAHEEVGIAPADVRVLGLLDDQLTTSGYVMTPVVGWIPHAYPLVLAPAEVALAFDLPVRAFVEPPPARSLLRAGLQRVGLAYEIAGHFIWGATARVLHDLARVVSAG